MKRFFPRWKNEKRFKSGILKGEVFTNWYMEMGVPPKIAEM